MINEISYLNTNNLSDKKISFKGAPEILLSGLGWMKNNPAMGACAVDFVSMVAPRSYVEAKERGKQSGIETFIREVSSLIIHATMGFIGFFSAKAISAKFNSNYNLKAENIFASGDTIQNLSEIWKNSNADKFNFFEKFVSNLKGLNCSKWNCISNKTRKEIVSDLIQLSEDAKNLENLKGKDKSELLKQIKQRKSLIISKITKDTGAKTSFKLNPVNSAKEISANISELIDNAVSLSNAFPKENIDKFVKDLKHNKKIATIIGLGITSLLCISVQPINRLLTKKRTGNDGFVGVDSKENDNSLEFKAMKTLAGIGFPIFAISTIGCKFKDLLSNVQFNGKIPSLNQYKLVYGFTISSRLFASRDGNELRESLIKDTLGFSTWLLFGDFVSKLATRITGGKELINNPVSKDKKGISYAKDWLMNASVKSFEEILLPKSKRTENLNKPLNLKELYKNATPELKSKVAKAAGAQILGYTFSGVVLGWGIAKLNILITKYLHGRDKASKQMNKEINSALNYQKQGLKQISYPYRPISPIFKEFEEHYSYHQFERQSA